MIYAESMMGERFSEASLHFAGIPEGTLFEGNA